MDKNNKKEKGMDEVYFEIGKRIYDLRKEKGLSREEAGALMEVTPEFLYEIENGLKGFTYSTLQKIKDALGATSSYILTGDKPWTEKCWGVRRIRRKPITMGPRLREIIDNYGDVGLEVVSGLMDMAFVIRKKDLGLEPKPYDDGDDEYWYEEKF